MDRARLGCSSPGHEKQCIKLGGQCAVAGLPEGSRCAGCSTQLGNGHAFCLTCNAPLCSMHLGDKHSCITLGGLPGTDSDVLCDKSTGCTLQIGHKGPCNDEPAGKP